MHVMDRLRYRLIASECDHCKGATHVPLLQKLTSIIPIGIIFIVLGFGFSTFTMFGNETDALSMAVSLTAFASVIIGMVVCTTLLRIVCAILDIKLCWCRR
jgi:hypothetical protein